MKGLITTAIVMAMAVMCHAGLCLDRDVNVKDCLRDTTKTWPTFRNGDRMFAGQGICWGSGGYSMEVDTIVRQGISISVLLPKQICRQIIEINEIQVPKQTRYYTINKACCKLKNPYFADHYKQCINDVGMYNWECKDGHDSTYYITSYERVYSDSFDYKPNYSGKKMYVVKQSADAFIDNDMLELYRKDGTLRYAGKVTITDTLVITKGECYDRKGMKPVRKTNNADLCK